ncbi:MAG: class 3 adenylate cyclase [Alphaproteobacteria bacterium]|jgi:class 3 adenylate cyclase
MSPSEDGQADGNPVRNRRRSLRAVFAADIVGFSGRMSLNETNTVNALSEIRVVGRRSLEKHNGWLFGMPGDGLFATFESAVSAVQCALEIQLDINNRAHLGDMPLRIGIHLGEVIIDDDLPYGETLNIAARLESLADPGGILVSGTVMDAVSARVSATFESRGVPILKNIPRRIPTFAVKQPPARSSIDERQVGLPNLDRTTRLDRNALKQLLGEQTAATQPKKAESPSAIPTSTSSDAADQPNSLVEKLAKLPIPPVPETRDELTPDLPLEKSLRDPLAQPVPAEKPAIQIATNKPSKYFVDQITKALAVHLGPFSKLIVEREMKSNPDVFELISKLEEHVPNADERLVFRVRASHINAAANAPGNDA